MQDDLGLPRAKPRSIAIAIAYRLMAIARRLFGHQRMLRFSLDSAWLFRQFAYQQTYMAVGPAFLNATHGITASLLQKTIPAGASVIDIGCGYGRLCRLAAPYARRVLGVDYDANRIALARRHTTDTKVEYRVADATTGLGTEVFDVAILAHALEHIDDVAAFLADVQTVARAIIVEVPDFEGDCLNPVRRDLGCRWYNDNDHVREYTLSTLCGELGRHGWNVTQAERRGGMLVAVATR